MKVNLLVLAIAVCVAGCAKETTEQSAGKSGADKSVASTETSESNTDKPDEGKNAAPAQCPKCGHDTIPIVYGEPGQDLLEMEERGEIVLGGCVVDKDSPTRYCANCKTESGVAFSAGR